MQVRFLGGKGATRAPYLSDQQAVSKLEQSENIEEEALERIAKVLGVSADAIRHFNEETVINNIQNNYEGSSSNYSGLYQCTFNPIDKLIEVLDENKKLYERLLESEKEKVELLKKQAKN